MQTNRKSRNLKSKINAGAAVEIILIVVLFVLVIVLLGWIAFLEWRHRQLANSFRLLMTGHSGADLETTLLDFVARLNHAEQITQTMDHRVTDLEVKLPYLVQHVGVVRFNPFADKGGDQSFVLAILDDHADGVVRRVRCTPANGCARLCQAGCRWTVYLHAQRRRKRSDCPCDETARVKYLRFSIADFRFVNQPNRVITVLLTRV